MTSCSYVGGAALSCTALDENDKVADKAKPRREMRTFFGVVYVTTPEPQVTNKQCGLPSFQHLMRQKIAST